MKKEGLIVTITGPSASGKSHLEKAMVREGFKKIVSTTTREQRPGEIDGEDYNFVPIELFLNFLESGHMVESVTHSGKFYGVHRREILNAFESEKPVVVVVEPDGKRQIESYAEENNWDVLTVYLDNSLTELVGRYIKRMDKTKDDYSKDGERLVSLVLEEVNWLKKDPEFDMVFDKYGAENGDEILAMLVDYAVKWQEYNSEKEVA